jgi:hypothetical protein
MSELLGPHGKATLILMRAHFETELPKLRDLKRLLNIPDGRYYKSAGRHSYEINKLHRLLAVLHELRGEERDWHKTSSSDYLVTVAEVHSNLFMTLTYQATVLDGFNLTDLALAELDKLLNDYGHVCSMRSDITDMWNELTRNSKTATERAFSDSTILKPDLPALQAILSGYGDSQYAKICQDLWAWYDTYRWKVKSPSETKSSSEDDATEDAAVS